MMDTRYSYNRLIHRLAVLCDDAKLDDTPIMEAVLRNCLLYFSEHEQQLWSLSTLTGTPEGDIRARFAIDTQAYPERMFNECSRHHEERTCAS